MELAPKSAYPTASDTYRLQAWSSSFQPNTCNFIINWAAMKLIHTPELTKTCSHRQLLWEEAKGSLLCSTALYKAALDDALCLLGA